MRPSTQERMETNETKRLICAHLRSFAAMVCLALTLTLSAQTRLTLQEAGARMAPDWTPVYDGKEVLVSGQVSLRPLWVSESLYLPIQDQAGYGLLVEGS